MTGRFRVSPDQLAAIVEELDRFEAHLEEALTQADARVNRLHTTWSGPAAEAHRAAHDEWEHGAAPMRAVLAAVPPLRNLLLW